MQVSGNYLRRARRQPAIAGAGTPGPSPIPGPTPTPTPAPVAPGYLDMIVVPYAAWGSQRIVPGYGGNLLKLRRTSDGALADFACQSGGDYPDYAAIAAWAGAATVRVNTWFDQSGNGRNLVAPSEALEPWIDLDHPQGGHIPLIFDHAQRMLEVGSLVLDQTTMSFFGVRMGEARQRSTGVLQFTDEAGSTAYLGYGGTGTVWPRAAGGKTAFASGQWTPPRPVPTGVVPNTTQAHIYNCNNTGKSGTVSRSNPAWSGGAIASQALARLQVGVNTVGGADNGNMWLSALAIYDSALDLAQSTAVWNSLKAAFACIPDTAFEYAVTVAGDSIVDGFGSSVLRTAPQILREQLTKNALIYNKGMGGDTLNSAYSARTSRYGGTVNVHSGIPNVIFVQYGTNDLAGVSALTTAAALYAAATDFVAYLQGQGYEAVLCTLLPRADGSWNGTREAERLAYNDLVRGNAAGADHVLDFASHPVMGASEAPNDPTLYGDGVHPTSLGYRWLAGEPEGAFASEHSYYAALVALGLEPEPQESTTIAGTSIFAGSPTLQAPALAQVHVLAAAALAAAAPQLTAQAISQVHSLHAATVGAGAPVLGSPAIEQVHGLQSAAIAAGQPTLGTLDLGSTGSVPAEGVTAGQPQLSAAPVGQVHRLAGSSVTAGAPSIAGLILGDGAAGELVVRADRLISGRRRGRILIGRSGSA